MSFTLLKLTKKFLKTCNRKEKYLKFLSSEWKSSRYPANKQSKLYKIAGITTIFLTSYLLIKKNWLSEKSAISTNNLEPDSTYFDKLAKTNNCTQIVHQSKDEETLREKYNFIDKVVKKCASAVFYLEIRDPGKKDLETGEPVITSNGSGFVISEDGWALTNAHVVLNKPQSTIMAIFRNGTRYPVKVEDADINMDLALLKIDAPELLPKLEFGDPGDTSVGEWVVALGSPLSLSNSVTVGIISCVNRPAEELGLKNYSMTYIQTDASITFGNSGGPLVNLDGNVIGINNLRLTSGISFAIPIEYARRFLENRKLIGKDDESDGIFGKTLFGMTTISVNLDVINDLLRDNKNIPKDITQGLLVWKLLSGTPAQL